MVGFKSSGLVLALIAALMLSACSNGGEEEIAEIRDGKTTAPPTTTITITGVGNYSRTLTVNYAESPTSTITKSISGTMTAGGTVQLASQPPIGALIVSIETGTNPPIYVGRLIEAAITLKLNLTAPSGDLELRPADSEGKIPIGTDAEFQLIRTDTVTLAGSYKQEADIDLMGNADGLSVPDWEPVGTDTAPFIGNFDGDGKKIDRLYINDSIGGVAGQLVNGKIVACYNTGKVTGGRSVVGMFKEIAACYWLDGTQSLGWDDSGDTGKFENYFTPSTGDSAEWGTGQVTVSGTYWKEGTTNGTMLPKLWYEE